MLAGIIFDFDGVIIDSHPLHMAAWKAFLLSKSKHVNDADLSFVSEGAKREEILRHFLGDLTPEQVASYGAEKDKLFRARAGELQLVRGFVDFMTQLDTAGVPSAVATSGSRTRVEHTLQRLNLRQHFRAVVTGDEVVRGKPDPALFLLAAQALQIDASGIMVFEDAVAGVLAAKSAAMKCIGIAANGRESMLKQAGADLVVADFTNTSLNLLGQLFA